MADHVPYPGVLSNSLRIKEPTADGRPQVAVVGAGPAGLMAAEVLARGGATVTVFDRMPSAARKLLLAGRGGLNVTHSEGEERFLARYGAAAHRLAPPLQRFGPEALRGWCADLGIDTFVGTSGRVFPTCFKTSPLLRAWLRRLTTQGVRFQFRHRWHGWDAVGRLQFETPEGCATLAPDATVLALGGASWPHLGSDGLWVEILRKAHFDVAALEPANCGFVADISPMFRSEFEGQPLKNVALTFAGRTARGDAMVTRSGFEGGPVYGLAAELRAAVARDGQATLHVALRPDLPSENILARLGRRRAKESLSNALRKNLGLVPVAVGLLREAAANDSTALGDLDPAQLARLVNAVPVRLTAPMPIDRAISTAGGVRFEALGADFMLRPGLFVAGEMIDWEAPTGGYLLQACFATGMVAGEGALAWLATQGWHVPANVRRDAATQIMV
jgi:uncharacterized flavoprotein (TIGR03862 family)